MRPLHRSILATCTFAILFAAQPSVVYSQPASLWDHNNSVMALYADGPSRAFRYHQPRTSMQQEGVRSGTLLFSGTKSGDTYSGTAYVFSRRCGAHPYHVSGTVGDDGRAVTMTGTAPAGFDAACRPIVFREDVLVFSFLQSLTPPPIEVGSIDRDQTSDETAAARAGLEEARLEKEREEQRVRDLRDRQERQARDIRDQQDRAERVRRDRVEEERRLAELRAFSSQREACRRYDIAACDIALRSLHAGTEDLIDLRNWRGVAEKFRVDFDSCKGGSLAACDAALASAAVTDQQRPAINEWRIAASPFYRALAFMSAGASTLAATGADAVHVFLNLPTSTHVTGGIAAVLALALAGLAWRSRNARQTDGPRPDVSVSAHHDSGASQVDAPNSAPRPTPPERPEQKVMPVVAARTRDTPGAIAALELAHAYIEEVREADAPGLEDEDLRKHHLNTLSLASRQLDAAERSDPDAILEGQDEKDVPYRYSINELKSEALLFEGITHQTYDTKRAVPALRKATALNPNNCRAFYVLGLTCAANMNKAEAVAAFERAVALDPKNLAYRKELNRAQSLSGGEIVAYKATRAGEKIFDAGIKTANAGIFVCNVSIYTWNVFAVIWNIVTFPLRLVLKIFGVFDRILGIK